MESKLNKIMKLNSQTNKDEIEKKKIKTELKRLESTLMNLPN
jgi:hypothetical protein